MAEGMDNSSYILGLDGGGTKTSAVLLSESALMHGEVRVLGRAVGGSINMNGASTEIVQAHLEQLFQQINNILSLSRCAGIGIGTAGVTNTAQRDFLHFWLSRKGFTDHQIHITGDEIVAMEGAFGGGDGILVISGTGSIAYGKRDGRITRTGGWGYLVGDEGSGYAIGIGILRSVLRTIDGREPSGNLTQLVRSDLEQRTGVTYSDEDEFAAALIGYLYDAKRVKGDIASFAALLEPALAQDDPGAAAIAAQAAEDICLLTVNTARQLSMDQGDVVYRGGVLEHNHTIHDKAWSRVQTEVPGLRLVAPQYNAAIGAALCYISHPA